MNAILENAKKFIEFQNETLSKIYSSQTDMFDMMPPFMKDMYGSQVELIKKMSNTEDYKLFYENFINFQKSYIAYHQSIVDMQSAALQNLELIKKHTEK